MRHLLFILEAHVGKPFLDELDSDVVEILEIV